MDEDDEDFDHSECDIIWGGPPPSPERIAMVRQSIKAELNDLAEPSDLIFHTVFFAKDPEGPTAVLWGDPKDAGKFHGEWSETTEWATASELVAIRKGEA